ncbi:hypothetical protein ECANGB1_1549 [Enterospora canceri]|uniref:Uncharacterized protein n=1 Tax=Enterospora canceri TaxID=1081671 RepID=A0A1Y1S5T0_9MICR|nr:hypothetical protein ECANGB1_1549 [Enterospora canceri]
MNNKQPKNVLVIAKVIDCDLENYPIAIDTVPKDKEYDLLVYVDYRFNLDMIYPYSIANAEIWYERGDTVDCGVMERAFEHYRTCEIREGK